MSLLPETPVVAAYAGACVVLAAAPGPDMALFLQKTLGLGRVHGFSALAGVMTGVLVHTFAAALGLSALIAASGRLYDALKVVGALYLLYLACGALRHGTAMKPESAEAARTKLSATFASGVLINLTNPKIILFFVTFLPQFIDPGDPDARGRLFALGLGFVVIATLVNGAVILAAHQFVTAARRRPEALRGFDYAVAALMGGFAARLLWTRTR